MKSKHVYIYIWLILLAFSCHTHAAAAGWTIEALQTLLVDDAKKE